MPGFDVGMFGSCHWRSSWAGDVPEGKQSGPQNTEETARRYRYEFQILEPLDRDTEGSTFLLMFAYKATRPTPEIDKIVVHNGQDEIYRPGKHRWNPIDITFYERVSQIDESEYYDQPAKLLYKWWAGTPYGTEGGVIHLDVSLQGKKYKKPCQLAMLDGYGQPIWSYYLANAWPMKISPCDLSYADTEIADITVTMSYDKAIEERSF